MAKDRLTICKFYVCEGSCTKDREASHMGYCNRCDLYRPRCSEHHVNKKKVELDKVRQSEANDLIKNT